MPESNPSSLSITDDLDWSCLVRDYDLLLRRTVRRTLAAVDFRPAQEDVDDIVQDTYCRLIGPGSRFSQVATVNDGRRIAYLKRSARSAAADWIRRARSAKRGAGFEQVPMPTRRDSEPDPEERLIVSDEQGRLRARLRRAMPGRRRGRKARVIELAVVHEYDSHEVAERVGRGMTSSGVNTTLCRLRRHLVRRGPECLGLESVGPRCLSS